MWSSSSSITPGERKPLTSATATGKKHRYIEITAFGKTPVIPMLPRRTMTIGAIASTGTVCEAMTQGKRLRSRVREWTMSTAMTAPSRLPMTKPSKVAELVTPA